VSDEAVGTNRTTSTKLEKKKFQLWAKLGISRHLSRSPLSWHYSKGPLPAGFNGIKVKSSSVYTCITSSKDINIRQTAIFKVYSATQHIHTLFHIHPILKLLHKSSPEHRNG
jgi:hypothetical protein